MIILKKTISVIFALLLCVSVLFTGCNKGETPQGGVVDMQNYDENAPVVVKPEISIQEGETVAEVQLGAGVEAFISNAYYLEGNIYSGSEGAMPVKLATDGKNLQFTTDFAIEDTAKIVFGVIVLDEKTYVTLPEKKQYTELSDTLLKMLDMDSFMSAAEFQTIKGDEESGTVTYTKVTINGQEGLCTTYTYADSIVKLYSIGDQLIEVDNCNMEGVPTMIIEVKSITSQIPSDQLTLKGLTQASATSFFASLIG